MIPFPESAHSNRAVVITGAKPYNGCTGRVVGLTSLLPAWYIVDLDGGGRAVVRPGHCEPLADHRCATCDQLASCGRYCEACQGLAASVSLGVQLLNERAVGWHCWPQLKLETLDMEWHGYCLLSQLFGSYEEGLEYFEIGPLLFEEGFVGAIGWDSYGWEYGFTLSPRIPAEGRKLAFARLTALWKQVIVEIRQVPA